MRHVTIVLALLAAAGPLLPQKIGEVPRHAPDAKAPRETTLEWSSQAGQPFWYRLPQRIEERDPPALIFMLHGTGLNHGWAFWNYGIDQGGFRKGDIVVSPDGVTPGQGATFNFVQNKDDEEQMLQLIKLFKQAFPIGNVYLYGHSQGAFFCYWFAGEHPELVDGFIAHAGNVLNVKHSNLAKKNLAVGILHAESDPVVSVQCAYRTHEIYEKQGYEKLRLYIVKGIREQAGHWPLPAQVTEMFDWLDQVCAKTPGAALDVAEAEIKKEAPDLAVVRETLESADDLLRRYRGKDRDEVSARLNALRPFLDACAAAHAEALADAPGLKDGRAPFGPWAAHFRAVHAALEDKKPWKDAMRSLASRADRDDRSVARTLSRLEHSGGKDFHASLGTLEDDFLAPRYPDLRAALERIAGEAPKGVRDQDLQAFRDLVAARAPAEEEGRANAASITAACARRFLESRSDKTP